MEDTWWELWCQSILLAVAHHKNTTNYYCLISRKKHTFVELDENCFALILFFIQPHYFYRQENCRVWPVLFWVIKKGVSSLLDEELKSHQTAQRTKKIDSKMFEMRSRMGVRLLGSMQSDSSIEWMKCNKVVVVCGENSQLVYYGFLNNNNVCFDGADICIKIKNMSTLPVC
jgi:hypothetical protein